MTVRIQDLVVGDELHVYLRLGMALTTKVNRRTGQKFRCAPGGPRCIQPGDLTRAVGTLVENRVSDELLILNTQGMNSSYHSFGESLRTLIPYSYLKRCYRVSPYASEPARRNPYRPTKTEGLNTRNRPYKTRELVVL